MSKSKPDEHKPARGTLLTVALVLVIFSNLIMTIAYWSTQHQTPNSSLAVGLLLLASAACVVAGIAMWYWKRWGLYLYAAAAIVSAVVAVFLTVNVIMAFSALLPPIIVGYIVRPKLEHFT
jgi:hypothetical protein